MFYAPTYCPGSLCDPCITLEIIGGYTYQGIPSVALGIQNPPLPPDDEVPPGPPVGTVTMKISLRDNNGLIAPGPTISGPIFWQGASTGFLGYLGVAPLPQTPIATPAGFDNGFIACGVYEISGPFSPVYDGGVIPVVNGAPWATSLDQCPP